MLQCIQCGERWEDLDPLLRDYDKCDCGGLVQRVASPHPDTEACPGCGKFPGEGTSPFCSHPDGCGFRDSLDREGEE